MPDPRKKLYDALTSNNFDLGSYEEFNSKMDNSESRKKLYNAASENKFDLGSYDDFESKIAGKKKSNSSSTFSDPKLDSEPKTGSSGGQTNTKKSNGFPTIESNNPLDKFIPEPSKAGKNKEREKKLQKELASIKVTPENMDLISSKTDELSALEKEADKTKQAEKNYRVSQLENSFYNATTNNDDDAVAEQRLQDAVQVKGIWNNVKNIAKNAYNSTIESIATTNPGSLGLLKYQTNTDPLASEKKQVISEARKKKEKLTENELNEKAGELFKLKEKDNLFIDRANSFLDDLDPKDKNILMQDRALKADHLEEDNLKRLKVTSAMRTVAESKISEYKDIESQLMKLKENNQQFPEDLYEKYQSLGSQIKNIGAELQKNEDYILKNKKDLGTAKQELDLFTREYGDFKNFVGNIGASASELGTGLLGAVNYVNSFSPNTADQVRAMKGQEIVSGLNKDIEENRKNLRTPVGSVESPEGFLNYASDLVANQLPILAVTASGAGGLTTIGASSAGKKFTEMNNEIHEGKNSYSPLQMATAPLLYGGAEMVGEYATMGILRKGGRVLESIARGETDLIKKTAVQKAKEWSKDFGVDMSKEMSGEQFTNFAQNFNDKFVLGKKDVNLLDNTGTVFKDTFTLTSILKAAPHVFGAVIKPFQSSTDLGKMDENSKRIIEFSRQLESEDLTDIERQVIEKQIEKATAESSKIVANTIGKIDNMPTELYDAVVNINTKAGEIKAQAREITDGNLSNKEELLKGLQEDYKALQDKRNSIIEGNTSTVEVLPMKEQEKLKKQALEDLVTELNPDGKKDMSITNEQILERANEIYSESKNNESSTEVVNDVVIPPAPEDYNIVDEKPLDKQENNTIDESNQADNENTNRIITQKGEVTEKLNKINRDTFGLDEKQSKASTAIMEKTLETMAKRSHIPKEEMFDRITFEKGDSNTVSELSKKGNSLFQIIGKSAKLSTETKNFLKEAISLEKQGTSAKDIYLRTGWEKGSDGKWKYDMHEGKVEFKNQDNGKLNDVLDYQELFEKYPESKNIDIVFNPNLNGEGMYDDKKNRIFINPQYGSKESKLSLLHEIQHWIQDKEGFSKGGTPEQARQFIEKKISESTDGKVKSTLKKFKNLIAAKNSNISELNNTLSKLEKIAQKEDFKVYQSIAGEVEARNVESRSEMTLEQRKQTSISETEDIAKDEQIVLFQGEQGAMLAEDGKFLIYALENPNVSTPLHELAHVYEHYLTDSERKTVLDDSGHKEWSRETSEYFARSFEKYLADGIAPNPEMKKLFEDFKKWLTDIYNGITNSEIDIKLSPEMQKIYDVMLGENNLVRSESSTANFKGSEFTIERNTNGEVKIFNKDGKEIKQYTTRKTKDGSKKVKNANYYKILTISEGNQTENEINTANKKQIQESIDNFIPSNEYEVALLEVAKGTKFAKESLEKELGNKDSNWASDQFSKKKTTSIENVAEGIVAENPELNLDEQEVRNALIDVLGSYENIDAVKDQLNDTYLKSIDPYFGLSEADAINAYEEFMTDSERTLFESVQAEENLSEEEKLKYYQEQYEKSIESIPAGERAGIYEQFESDRSERLPNSPESNENGNSENGSQRQDSEEKVKSSADQFLSWLDEIENNLDQFGKENLSVGLPIVAAKIAIEAMRTAVKAGMAIADVIQAGLDAIKQSEWFKNLSQADQTQAEKDFMDTFGNPQIDPDNVRQTENLLNRASSENISEDEAFDEVSKTFEKAREELRNEKPSKEYVRDAYRNFVRRFTDRQYLSKSLLSKSGLRNTKNLIINSKGASGKAKILFEEAYNKIYKGLTRADRNQLDEIIQAKRFITIDKNREARGLEPVSHPNFIDGNKSEKWLSKLEKNLGQEKYADLEKRAKEYFKTYKDLLQQVYDNGLISKESFDSMNDLDYQPRVFLQFVTDFNGDMAVTKKTNNLETGGLSSEQIKSMKEGDASNLVLNSEWLLTNSLLARQKAVAMNNINKRFMSEEYPKALKRFESLDPNNLQGDDKRFYKYFKELSSKVIDNPYIGQTASETPKFKFDKTPANFQKAYYYIDGKQHQFFLEQGLYDSWTDNFDGLFKGNTKEILSYASGSALVKAIATGNNPAFPIVNTPRDFMFTTTFSDQYSKFVPKAMLQVGKDAFKSFKELRNHDNSDILKKYFEYGGAMDFLSSEGRLKKNSLVGKTIEKVIDPKVKDIAKNIFSKVTLSKISEYSEMMFRLGIFQRSIQNQLKDLGFKDISEVTDKQQKDDIYNEAVTSARSILDFNQGGTVTKDLEALVPYINVAFQGGRVAATAFEKDPIGTTSRVLQVATLASSIPVGISLALLSALKPDDDDKSAGEIYLQAMDGISTYQKSKYMNIPIPIKNSDGEYMVIKIAKAQELSPVMSVTDDIYNNLIRSMVGKEKKSAGRILDDAAFTFNSTVMPIDFTSPAGFFTRTPIVKGTLSYTTGYDFFRDEPLSNDIGKVPLPVEGINNPNVEDFYKKIGSDHGVSPIRSKAFVESLITGPNTNPFVGMLYGGMDAAVSDKDMKKIGGDFAKSIYKSTGKRLISYSSQFNRELATQKNLQEKIDKINIEKYKMKAEFNQLAKDYINKDVSKEEVNKKLEALDPADRKRMVNKIKDKVRLKGIDGTILDIKYEQGNDVKALMIMHYYGDITDGSKDSKDILRQMKRAKGILTPGVIHEYKKLKKELETKKAPK